MWWEYSLFYVLLIVCKVVLMYKICGQGVVWIVCQGVGFCCLEWFVVGDKGLWVRYKGCLLFFYVGFIYFDEFCVYLECVWS